MRITGAAAVAPCITAAARIYNCCGARITAAAAAPAAAAHTLRIPLALKNTNESKMVYLIKSEQWWKLKKHGCTIIISDLKYSFLRPMYKSCLLSNIHFKVTIILSKPMVT